MRKKRILFCGEATFLNTGYATYAREILNYLYSTGKYELAEYAAYGYDNDPRFTSPWKFFGAIPDPHNKELTQAYKQSGKGQFGAFQFEKVCLKFLPDIVCDIRDFWMIDFVHESPFRKCFKWAIMPTVDAMPQATEWINMYNTADACFSYSDWSGDLLKQQSGNHIKYLGSAPPSAHKAYQPIEDKQELKHRFGLDPNLKIVGTVMRNQRRKLYPDLFEAFRKFLNLVPNPSEYKLYCHTSYPDAGWNIPELLNQHNLCSHVLFTYICQDTNMPFVSHFNGAIMQSPFTGNFSAKLANVKHGLSYEYLAQIVNLFDIYIQYANCEGFGLPQVEAAACGVPVMSVDYSAMSSVIKTLEGIPIPPKALYKEMETGCYRAVPDNDKTAELLVNFFNKPEPIRKRMGFQCRENFLNHFQWHKSGAMWENYFDSVELLPIELTWKSSVDIQEPSSFDEEMKNKTYNQIVDWLFDKVLCQPYMKYTFEYRTMISNLMYGFSTSQIIGSFFNEEDSVISLAKKIEQSQYTIESAYTAMVNKRKHINFWEQQRARVLMT